MKKHIKPKFLELILLYIYFSAILASGIVFDIKNYILFIFLLLGIPGIYFFTRLRESFRRVSWESLIITVPIGFILEYMSHINNQWYVPGITGIKVFNLYPVEEFLWVFIMSFSMIILYEYFFDSYKRHKISYNFLIYTLFSIVVVLVFSFFLIFWPDFLNMQYFYLSFIVCGLIYILVILLKYPRLYKNVSLYALYLLPLGLVYELVALKLNHWSFVVGHHLGYVDLFNLVFPLEELMFIILVPYFVVLTHEVFADNIRSS